MNIISSVWHISIYINASLPLKTSTTRAKIFICYQKENKSLKFYRNHSLQSQMLHMSLPISLFSAKITSSQLSLQVYLKSKELVNHTIHKILLHASAALKYINYQKFRTLEFQASNFGQKIDISDDFGQIVGQNIC